MNFRELINQLEAIDQPILSETVTLDSIMAAVGKEPDEQKRADLLQKMAEKDEEKNGVLGSIQKSINMDSKIEEIFSIINEQGQESKIIAFEIGESVNVIDGPFESFAGVVEEFDVEKRKVKISILIFGRATSVELGIEQVEKIS